MLADAQTLADLVRRLANLVRPGRVEAADYTAARVRVRAGELLTDWLPWATLRAGGDVTWWAPEAGEQVLLLCPDGEPAQGWVLPAGFTTAAPAPADRPDLHRTVYADGALVEYDRAAHRLRAVIPGGVDLVADGRLTAEIGAEVTVTAGGAVTVKAPRLVVEGEVAIKGDVRVTGNLDITGNVSASGDMLNGGANSNHHKH